MNKHTPGPWFVDASRQEGLAIRHDSKMVCQIPGYGVGTRIDDARLIAAAPELLEALKMGYADTMDYIQRNHLSGSENNHWLVLARAAIAKATGGVKK